MVQTFGGTYWFAIVFPYLCWSSALQDIGVVGEDKNPYLLIYLEP
jgi:hypothetical protein